MCTVMTTSRFFGRTMDFPPRTPWHLTYLPAGFQWQPARTQQVVVNRYRILGGMRHFSGHYLIGDGVNAAGVLCAELFFPVAARYASQVRWGTLPLTPQDFITWVLGNCSSVAELAASLSRVTVVGAPWYDGNNYPFHWLLQDRTGTYLVEPLAGRLHVRVNPVGALTNTPTFDDQVTRLNCRLGLGGRWFNEQVTATYHGPWPTGGNSVERFQRAALERWQATPRSVTAMQRFLTRVTVPQTDRHRNNYTHYRAVFDRDREEYYFSDCYTGTTIKKCLGTLNGPQAITFN